MNAPASHVNFQLFSLGRSDPAKLSDFLTPQGTVILFRLGFPFDLDDCTCIPKGPVGFWSAPLGEMPLEAQWYQPAQPIERSDLAGELRGTANVKGNFCHERRPDPHSYPITSLHVDTQEAQWIGFIGKKVIFRRLGHATSIDLSDLPNEKTFTLSVEWSIDYIELRVTWVDSENVVLNSGWGLQYPWNLYIPPPSDSINRRVARTEFEMTLVPTNVIRSIWADAKETINDTSPTGEPTHQLQAFRKAYQNDEDFYQTVLGIITEVQQILSKTRPHGFWNGSSPKDEPDSGWTLRMLFEAICSYKNIAVSQEAPSRSGDVDFVFTGISIVYEHLHILLEIKNAHSKRLEHGLTAQLPKYLEERGIEKGVYGVLWFKGRKFTEPADLTSSGCLARLNAIKPSTVCQIVIFDVSFPVYASRL